MGIDSINSDDENSMIKGDLKMNSNWKFRLIPTLMALALFAITGCDDDTELLDPAPGAPQQVFSVTGDGLVTVYWNAPYESDIKEFVVLRSLEELDNYKEIARLKADPNPKLDLVQYFYEDATVANSITYFYAVLTVDFANQQSGLSAETVQDTPRPSDTLTLTTIQVGTPKGFNFDIQAKTDTNLADVFLTTVSGQLFLTARQDSTDIQDMGFTDDFDDITISPDQGWSAFSGVEVIEGHTYVIWTDDNHFAKMRARIVGSQSIFFDWAYQRDEGNPQLKPKHE